MGDPFAICRSRAPAPRKSQGNDIHANFVSKVKSAMASAFSPVTASAFA